MMENKCNKTPNSNSKYLDHVYCHPSETKNYIRANNNNVASGGGGTGGAAASGADFLALLKENKQLKAMLILHLELIQEQNEQLLSKDKQLSSQSDELETLRLKNTQLEARTQELQKQLQRQLKRAATAVEISSLPPPPLAKIERKPEIVQISSKATVSPMPVKHFSGVVTNAESASANIIGECNGKLISKIILHRVNSSGGESRRAATRSPNSTTASESASEADDGGSRKSPHGEEDDDNEEDEDDEDVENEDIGEEEDDDEEDDDAMTDITTTEDDSNDAGASTAKHSRRQVTIHTMKSRNRQSTTTAAAATTTTTTPTATTSSTTGSLQVCITPPVPSRGKQMPLMRWHAPEMHSESESASCDSIMDTDQHSTTMASQTTSEKNESSTTKTQVSSSSNLGPPLAEQQQREQHSERHMRGSKTRRCPYISTTQRYCTREWEDSGEFLCDYEFIKEEANALNAETPNLEIPKWTEHELLPSYCIEGTEDLCDETFLKRHAKFEVDEKRRKKWDVQQIREQRRIEKLKRRHCKDELQLPQDPQPLLSFYPNAEAVQTICYMNDLPVHAFGELIPKMGASAWFVLPWLKTIGPTHIGVTASTVTASARTQHNSSFVFLKKRRRQQSSSTTSTSTRQRHTAVGAGSGAAAGIANNIANVTVTPTKNATTIPAPISAPLSVSTNAVVADAATK